MSRKSKNFLRAISSIMQGGDKGRRSFNNFYGDNSDDEDGELVERASRRSRWYKKCCMDTKYFVFWTVQLFLLCMGITAVLMREKFLTQPVILNNSAKLAG